MTWRSFEVCRECVVRRDLVGAKLILFNTVYIASVQVYVSVTD